MNIKRSPKCTRPGLFLGFLFSMIFSLSVSAQSSCSTATVLSEGCLTSQTTTATTVWYKIVPTGSSVALELNSDSANFDYFLVYSGTCAGLSQVDSSKADQPTHNLYSRFTVTPSTSYYIKAVSSTSTQKQYDICWYNMNVTVAPCGCSWAEPDFGLNNCDNLVCNPSFNYVAGSPTSAAQVELACPWTSSGSASPDLFHTVTPVTNFQVPQNIMGYAGDHTGTAGGYAGVCTYQVDPNNWALVWDYKKYIVQQLSHPLVAGAQYYVSYWVCLSNNSEFKTVNMSLGFFNNFPTQSIGGLGPINASPYPLITATNYPGTNGWQQISGVYTASGGEQYIAIGNFDPDATSSPVSVTPAHDVDKYRWAYYYIDDVVIKPVVNITVTASASPNPVCANVPTQLQATVSPPGNFSYQWAPFNGVYNPYGSPTGAIVTPPSTTYTVIATSNDYNCQVSAATAPVTTLTAPNFTPVPDDTICAGTSVTLDVGYLTNATDRGWYLLNGTNICTGCTSVNVSPTVTTTYVFQAFDNHNGCSRNDTVKITVLPSPTATVTVPDGLTACGGTFVFTGSGGGTYHWTTDAPTSSGSNTSTFTAAWAGQHTNGFATLTVTNNYGCTDTERVVVPACCEAPGSERKWVNWNVDSVIAHFAYTVNGSYYDVADAFGAINGTLTINHNIRFKGARFWMAKDSKINILPGYQLELTVNSTGGKTKINAWCGEMWKGIYVDGSNSNSLLKIISGTVIEDAKNAVVSLHGGCFQITGDATYGFVKLNKNDIGVYIGPYAGTHPGKISKTAITCDAPTQPGGTAGLTSSGPNCISPVNGRGYAAVYVDSVTTTTIGDSSLLANRNLFERTRMGIYSRYSNVNVWNNDFKYITLVTAGHTYPGDGYCVYATGSKLNPRTLVVGRRGTYKAHNLMRKSSVGVYAQNYMNLSCEYNRLDSISKFGIVEFNAQGKTILINQDSLTECTGTNIQCINVAKANVTITDNKINQSQTVSNTNFGWTGIFVGNAVLAKCNSLLVSGNMVKKMSNCIWLSRVSNYQVRDNNPLTFSTSQTFTLQNPGIGIKLEEANNGLCRQNTISFSGTASAANYDKLFGIHVTNCYGDTVNKNTITNCGSGLFMKGSDNPSYLACNNFTGCYYNVNFNYAGGTQGPQVSLNHQLTWGSTTIYGTGNTFNTPVSGFSFKGKIQPIASNGIKWGYTGSVPTEQLIQGSLYNNSFWSASSDQCSNMLAPPSTTAATKRENLLGGICKNPRSYDTLNDAFRYHDAVFAYRYLRDNPGWLSLRTGDDTYYQNFYDSLTPLNIGMLADVEDAIASGDPVTATTSLSKVTPENAPEANRMTVLGVYLHSWALDSLSLSDGQRDTLETIATQFPITGGMAVFDARNMLYEEIQDSSSLRLAPSAAETTIPAVGHVYPNPTNGSIILNCALPEGQTGSLELYDLTGRKLISYRMSSGEAVQQFNVTNLPGGMYLCLVRINGTVVSTEKLILMHEE